MYFYVKIRLCIFLQKIRPPASFCRFLSSSYGAVIFNLFVNIVLSLKSFQMRAFTFIREHFLTFIFVLHQSRSNRKALHNIVYLQTHAERKQKTQTQVSFSS